MMALPICGDVIQSKSTYEWTVEKFSEKCKTFGESIWSPRFSQGTNNEFSWQLRLFPYGHNEVNNGYLTIYLYSKNYFTVIVSSGFTIKNIKDLSITKDTFTLTSRGYGYIKYAERSKVLDSIKHMNDVLTITCVLDKVTVVKKINNSPIGNPKIKILNNIGQLFINQEFCDVTIKADAKEFRAHKLILSAQSKVFAAMFKHDMIEKVKNVVEIEDVDCEVLEVMLKFIYSGEIENIEKITKELLVAADKYAIDELKNICIKELYNTIKADNAINLLLFADRYNFNDFKTNIMDFIISKATDIITKSEFDLLEDAPSRLVMDLFIKQTLITKP